MKKNTLWLLQLLLIFSWNFSFAQWSSSVLPNFTSGDFTTNAIVSTGSRLIAGTDNGIYVSDNNAQLWQPVYTGITNPNIFALIGDGAIIMAGGLSGEIFVSLDNGNTWQFRAMLPISGKITDFAKIDSSFFAVNQNGVFISNNQGTSWQQKNNGLTITNPSQLLVKGSQLLVCGNAGNVSVSSDNGENWQATNSGLPTATVNDLTTDGTTICAAVFGGVYTSTDNGANWSFSWTGMPATNVRHVSYLPSGRLLACSQGGILYISDNNGTSWITQGNPFNSTYITQIASHQSELYIAGNTSGIFHSATNGDSWTQMNQGMEVSIQKVFSLFGNIYASGIRYNYLSTDGGQSFYTVTGLPAHAFINATYQKGSRTYVGTGEGLYYTDDLGTSWTKVIAPNFPSTNFDINGIDGSGENIYMATVNGFYSSSDGINWQLSTAGFANSNIASVLVNGSKLFAVNANNVYESTDNGATWTIQSSLSSMTTAGMHSTAGDIFVYGSSLRYSADGGTSFNTLTHPHIGMNISDFKNYNGIYYAVGNRNHVYVSNDQGATWTTYSTGLLSGTYFAIRSIAFAGNKAVISTAGPYDVFHNVIPTPIVCPTISSINGPTTLCANQNNVAYTIAEQPNSTYNWQLSSSLTLVSGNGTASIIANIGTADGSISVTQSTPGCPDKSVSLPVSIKVLPEPFITGPAIYCFNPDGVKYYANTDGMEDLQFNWTIPSDATIISGQGMSSLLMNFGSTSGAITVQASNGCETSAVHSLNVTVENLSVLEIAGTAEVNLNAPGISYMVQAVPNATYSWTVPDDASIYHGQGTNNIIVNFGSISGDISVLVTSANGCGSETATFPVIVNQVVRPTAAIRPSGCGIFMGEFYNLSGTFPLKVVMTDDSRTYEFTLENQDDKFRMFPVNKTFTILAVHDANGIRSDNSGVSGSITTSVANLSTSPASSLIVSCGTMMEVNTTVIAGGTYEWFKLTAEGYYISIGNNDPYLVVTASGVYAVTYLKPDGCYMQSNLVDITVTNAPPAIVLNTTGTIDVPCGQAMNVVLSTTQGYPYYKWYKNDNLINGINQSSYTVTTPGTYAVTASLDDVCYSITNTTNTVTINQASKPPKPTLSGSGGIFIYCGKTTSLQVTNGYIYVFNKFKWYKDGVLISGANLASLTITENGLYTVEATMDGTCYSDLSASVSASVQNNTDLVINSSSGGFNISCGSSINLLTAPGYSSYNWYRNNVLIDGANSNLLTNVSQAGIYEVQSVGAGCTSTRASREIIVGNSPALLITPSTVSMPCGNTATLSTITGYSYYKWFKNGVEITNANASSLLVSESGQYAATASNDGICYTIPGVPAQVGIHLTGVFASVFCSKPNISCGEKALLGAGPALYNHYKWFRNGLEYATTNVSTLETITPGTYTVAVSNDNVCYTEISSSPVSVTLNTLPSALEINNAVNTFAYSYDSGNNTLAKTGANSGNFENYQWQYTPNASTTEWSDISGAVATAYDFTNVTGAYRLKGTFAGCPASYSNAVTPFLTNSTLTVSPIQLNAIMCGSLAKLTASPGHDSYSWRNMATNTIVAVTTLPEILLSDYGQGSGHYRVTGSGVDQAGVTYSVNSSNIIVQVLSDITPVLDIPVLNCSGTTGSITIANPNGVYASYEWKNGANEVVGTANQLLVSSGGTYTLNVTDYAGCSASVNAVVISNGSSPDFTPVLATQNGILKFCTGGNTEVQISNLASLPSGSFSYRWYKNGILIPSATNQTLLVTTVGNYSLQIIPQAGTNKCIAYSNELTIDTYPAIDVTVAGPPQNKFCIGMGQTLTAASGVGYSYQWGTTSAFFPPTFMDISGATAQQYAPTAAGIYQVRITDAHGCAALSSQNVVSLVNGPTTPVIYQFTPPFMYSVPSAVITTCAQITLSAINSSSGTLGGAVQWFKDGQAIVGANNAQLTVSEAGIYTLVLSQNNCSKTSTPVQIISAQPDATITFENTPAPASGEVTVTSCSGMPAVFKALSAPAGQTYTYSWYQLNSPVQSINGLIAVATTQSYVPTLINKFYVVLVSNGICSKLSNAYSISIVQTPSIVPIVASAERCREGEVTLTSTTALQSDWIYRWVDGQTNTIVQEGINNTYTTPLLTENKTYTISFVNGTCASLASTTATVSIQTPVAPLVSDTHICGKGKITLSVDPVANHNYNWYTTVLETPAVATGSSYTTPTLTSSKRFYVESFILVNGQECRSPKVPVLVTVKQAPNITVSPVKTQVCYGTRVSLSAFGAPNFIWKSEDGSILGENPTLSITPTTTATYFVTGTLSNGCFDTKTSTVKVNPLPVITITSDVGSNICAGTPVTLTASGGKKYKWSTQIDPTQIGDKTKLEVRPMITTNYIVVSEDNNGCPGTKNFQVNVQSIPEPPMVNTANTCLGQSAVLMVENPSPAFTYNWYDMAGTYLFSGTSFSQSALTADASYRVEAVSSGITCKSPHTRATMNVIEVTAATPQTQDLCPGEVVFEVSNPIDGQQYNWYNNATGGTPLVTNSPSYSATIFSYSFNTKYVETIRTEGGVSCAAPTRTAITINGLVAPNVNTNFPTHVDLRACDGVEFVLGATGANTYLWSSGATTQVIKVTITEPTAITVTGYGLNGCSTSKTFNYTVVTPRPAQPVMTADILTHCIEGNTSFSASGALAGERYYWTMDGANPQAKMSTSNLDNTWTANFKQSWSAKVYTMGAYGCFSLPATTNITVNASTALRFDGDDDKVTFYSGVHFERADFTIGASFKMKADQTSSNPVIFSKRSGNNYGCILGTSDAGRRISLWIKGRTVYSNTIQSIHDDQCHNIIVEVNFGTTSSTITFYRDGIWIGTRSILFLVGSDAGYVGVLGNDNYVNRPLKGELHAVSVWSKRLNSSEIYNYNQFGYLGIPAVHNWTFSGTAAMGSILGTGELGSSSAVESSDPVFICSSYCYSSDRMAVTSDSEEETTGATDSQNLIAQPNPFESNTTIQLNGFSSEEVNLMLTDMQGVQLWKKEKHPVAESVVLGEELQSGIYILQVTGTNEVQKIKIIKAK